jgi:Holliday junction resolvasome RuvABC endonuclease subunit
VIGIDPGFASLGVVIIEKVHKNIQPKVLLAETIQTKKADKKNSFNLRATNDDQRRYKEIWKRIDEIDEEYKPCALGIEAYRVFSGQGGNAWKSAVVYGGLVFWAFTKGMYVAPFLPTDIKKQFCGKNDASKKDVEERLCFLVEGLEATLMKIPKTRREHVADATGHALLAFNEAEEYRRIVGL